MAARKKPSRCGEASSVAGRQGPCTSARRWDAAAALGAAACKAMVRPEGVEEGGDGSAMRVCTPAGQGRGMIPVKER